MKLNRGLMVFIPTVGLALMTAIAVEANGLTRKMHTRRKAKFAAETSGTSPKSASLPGVIGSGSPGQLTKWSGSNGASNVLAGSMITEDKFGRIGIGASSNGSKLIVAGTIESTQGGYKFPDGTVQITAANSQAASADPAKNAFQQELFFDIPAAQPTLADMQINIPAGKRLVIEYIAIKAFGFNPGENWNGIDVVTTLNGIQADFQIVPPLVLAGAATFAADKQVKIYADAPAAQVEIVPGVTEDFVRVTVSGYLVDLP